MSTGAAALKQEILHQTQMSQGANLSHTHGHTTKGEDSSKIKSHVIKPKCKRSSNYHTVTENTVNMQGEGL